MPRPSLLGDFDVVAGPPAPPRRIAPAMPPPKSDRQQQAPARGNSGAPAGQAELPAP